MTLLRTYGPGSVVGIATAWTARRSNPGGGEVFRTCPESVKEADNNYWRTMQNQDSTWAEEIGAEESNKRRTSTVGEDCKVEERGRAANEQE